MDSPTVKQSTTVSKSGSVTKHVWTLCSTVQNVFVSNSNVTVIKAFCITKQKKSWLMSNFQFYIYIWIVVAEGLTYYF